MKQRHLFLFSALCFVMAACAAPTPRTISGRLVQSASRLPVAGQQLVLDRPPGDYEGIPIPLTGAPQPVTIAKTVTNSKGMFSFTTVRDKGRNLEVRLDGPAPLGPYGYAIASLKDSLSKSPKVQFDPYTIHKVGGGFQSTR